MFRVVAPDAQKVSVRIGRGFDMAKGLDGVWTATTTPLVIGFSDALTHDGIHNVYFESPGTAHEWLTWRRCLNDFAPRLFR